MPGLHSRPAPLDQADGLRRLFAHARVRFVPVASNPHVAFGGVLLERLCAAFAEHGKHVLVVDAAERSPLHAEMATLELNECVETLSHQVSYLAARTLPIKFVDTHGSTASFLQVLADAAPHADVVLVHAPAPDLCRMFAKSEARPLVMADDRPQSVTHAYAAMKLMTQRAGLIVHDLLLSAAPTSPRAERIAMQLATCADDFLGAVLRDWVHIDPATDAQEPPTPSLRRWARDTLQPHFGAPIDIISSTYGAHTNASTMN
ncbi:MinD/ParA family ATP-binding protein [Piscinibacter terrae]|uniref:Flagellar biosynthesis protein n=1 Tax=Piscinibacter terrae TaxID=2496871 RepID=A0A3N7HSH3_9BURK|nr:flagellar biosynthesis protein [Albitalea terrae]RQP25230.1 flagellar biosynthesis protein [Albitalea terrae]